MNLTHTIHDARRLGIRLVNRNYYEMLRDRRTGSISKDYYRRFDETRSIFVHIPKTGGVSVSNILYGNRAGHHANIATYQIVFPASNFYNYYKFAFVRNPWDRLYSAYRYHRSRAMSDADDLAEKDMSTRPRRIRSIISQARDFEDFVLNYLKCKSIQSFVHFRSQETFLRNVVTGSIGVDFVGRFERLDEDFATAARRIGKDVELPHLNRSGISGQYRDAYSAKMQEVAGKLYESDARLFSYAF